MKFQSGRTLSAEDVVWTVNRLKQSPDFKALFDPFVGAKAVDDLTVDLITKGPYPLVLNLATYIFPMDRAFYSGTDERGRPKDAIVKSGSSFASTHASGTGPFIVTGREPGVRLKLEALCRLLGQVLARQCRRDRVHADQGAGDARCGAARRRCRFHRAGASDRSRPHQGRSPAAR